MARFRGTIRGQRGEASRLGSPSSGLSAHIAGWQGAVDVELYDKDGVDMARVSLGQHHSRGQWPPRVLYDGPVSGVGK